MNTSVTEAFCIAALEAASAGLLVVTTNVGGTPEILPEDLLYLADPNVPSLYKMLVKAIGDVHKISASENNERVSKFYNWRDIAKRVEKTYYNVLNEPFLTFRERIQKCTEACKFFFLCVTYLLKMCPRFIDIILYMFSVSRPVFLYFGNFKPCIKD